MKKAGDSQTISQNKVRFSINPLIFFAALFAILMFASIALFILLKWAGTANLTYPDFVRQKLLIYSRNIFIIITLLALALFFVVSLSLPLRFRLRTLLPNILLVIAALLIALASAEIVVRFLFQERYVVFELHGIHRVSPHPEIVYELRPGAELSFYYKDQKEQITYQINSAGLRSPEIEEQKPDHCLRIITIGDSVTFGVRVDQDEIYSSRLEDMLNNWAMSQDVNKTFSVLNPSACGWNTFNEASWIEFRGEDFDPDIILVQFSMNDVDDPLAHMGTTILYHLKEIPHDFFPVDPGISKNVNIFTHTADDINIRDVLRWYGPRISKLYAFTQHVFQGIKLKHKASQKGTHSPLWLSWCLDYLADPSSPQVEWLKKQFVRLKSLSDYHRVPLVIVIFPLSYQLNTDNSAWRKAIQNVKLFIKDAGLDYLDLTPFFEDVSGNNQFYLYLSGDASHLNAAGHNFTAQRIHDFLLNYPPLHHKIR